MRKILLLIPVLLFAAASVRAQCTYTSVSATITDPNGVPYSFANISADLAPNPPGGATCTGGAAFPGHVGPIQTSSTGAFTMLLPANGNITPSGTQWQFTVSMSPGVPLPFGTGPQTFILKETITGSTQNLTSAFDAAAPALTLAFGGSGSSAFSAITSGTNTTATMTVGTGATLGFSGSGAINASAIDGVTITGTPSSGTCPVASSSSAGTWTACASVSSPLTLGYRLHGNGADSIFPSSALIDIAPITGSDWTLKQQNAWAGTSGGCPNANVQCNTDGSGFSTTQAGSVNAYANLTGNADVSTIIPCQTINLTAQQSIEASDVYTYGSGTSSGCNAFQSNTGFPNSEAVFNVGLSTGSTLFFGDYFQNLRINATGNGSTGDWAFEGGQLQEFSGWNRVNALGINSVGTTHPLIQCVNCAHSYWEDLQVGKSGLNDIMDFQSQGNSGNFVLRATANNTTNVTGLAGFHFESSTGGYTFNGGEALHGEGIADVVQGSANTGGMANMIDGSGTCTDVLHLDSGAFVWSAEAISAAGCTNMVNDLSLTPNVVLTTANYSKGLGFYTNGAIASAAYIGRVDAYTGTHTVANNEEWLNISNTTSITVNPALTGQFFYIFNNGASTVTVAPSSGTISGNGTVAGASIPVSVGNLLFGLCDGTNCYAGITGGSSSSGANASLSNLASVGVNVALLPGTDASISLDSTTFRYVNSWLSGVAGWTNGSGTADAGLSRGAAGVIDVGTGTAGSTAGTLTATVLNALSSMGIGSSPPSACGSATGCVASTEAATAGTPTTGVDYFRADSGTHRWLMSNNDGSETAVVGPATTDTFTNKSIAGSEINSGTVPSAQLPVGSSSQQGILQCGTGTTCSGGTLTVSSGASGIPLLNTAPFRMIIAERSGAAGQLGEIVTTTTTGGSVADGAPTTTAPTFNAFTIAVAHTASCAAGCVGMDGANVYVAGVSGTTYQFQLNWPTNIATNTARYFGGLCGSGGACTVDSLGSNDSPSAGSLDFVGIRYSTIAGDTAPVCVFSNGTATNVVNPSTAITPNQLNKYELDDNGTSWTIKVNGTTVCSAITTDIPASGTSIHFDTMVTPNTANTVVDDFYSFQETGQ